MCSLKELAFALRHLKSALVVTHVSPDADAIGSSAALVWMLSRLGAKASLFLSQPAPEKLRVFLTGIPLVYEPLQTEFDALVVVDTAADHRTSGEFAELSRFAGKVINIDHHVSNTGFGDLNYIDPAAPASAAIIFELSSELGLELDAATADRLLAGLMDDTGAWRFSNADERSFTCAAHLVRCGAQAEFVGRQLFFSLPEKVMKLRAASIVNLQRVCGDRVAFSCVTREMLESYGASAEDTEGIINLVRSVDGTLCAVFMRELEDGWKISLRSKADWLDVNAVCADFGGGGHRAAAGCKILGCFESAKSALVERLARELDQGPVS